MFLEITRNRISHSSFRTHKNVSKSKEKTCVLSHIQGSYLLLLQNTKNKEQERPHLTKLFSFTYVTATVFKSTIFVLLSLTFPHTFIPIPFPSVIKLGFWFLLSS